ncbi:MAG: hypothetical protein HRT74_07920 [Flavobacteriales bacterium]|nr:hypothetical protein [Flavobacteriales bacterium]
MVLVSRVPYPLEKGDKLRAYHQIRQLSKNHEVHLCCLSDGSVHPDAKKELLKVAHQVEIINLPKWRIALNLFFGLFGDLPLQVNYFFQRQAQKKVKAFYKSVKPDHIYCQLIRTSEY